MDFDVIIIGAGPGGCVAARDLARAGFRVALFDSDSRETLGKTIIIEAEKAMFDTVSVAHPSGDEIPYHPKTVRVFSARGKEAFQFKRELPSYGIFLDRMVKRMLAEAEQNEAEFFGGWRALGPVVSDGKVTGASFEHAGSRRKSGRN